jgi:hypothetical protein
MKVGVLLVTFQASNTSSIVLRLDRYAERTLASSLNSPVHPPRAGSERPLILLSEALIKHFQG